MGSLWFLKLSLKCIDHFAWPLLALGYPLYASVKAIETDSYADTRALISYWILFSLIYLFEFAFMRLLLWFQFWPYIKLMVIFCLIIPDFGRSFYVYNYLVHSSVSMKPEAVISKLKNWKKLFVKKENFLLHAERYILENGTEALEKLVASKNTTHNPDAEATNAFRATDKEMQQKEHHVQTNGKKHQTEHKDIKDLEAIEKKEIPAGKKDIPIMPNLAPSQNTSSAMVETKGMLGKDTAGGELPQSSAHKEVQKEWTCALCQVKTTCEQNLISHLHGRKHKDTCEALKAKQQKLKNDQSKEKLKQNIINHHAKEHARTSRESEKSMLNDAVKQGTTKSESQGSKKIYVVGVHASANKTEELNAKTMNGESIFDNGLKVKAIIDHKVQELQKNLGKPVLINRSKLRCEVCNVTCTSEGDMASHLNGRKHLAQIRS